MLFIKNIKRKVSNKEERIKATNYLRNEYKKFKKN